VALSPELVSETAPVVEPNHNNQSHIWLNVLSTIESMVFVIMPQDLPVRQPAKLNFQITLKGFNP
jgi:hypothetical protein